MSVDYPIPTHRFRVSIDDEEAAFNSVSGLDVSHQTMEYRDGMGGWYQMPGQADAINITLKKGVFVGQSKLYDWISSISGNQVEKKDITISLMNESGDELFVTWNLVDAFPTRLTAPILDADSNEATIEELSLLVRRVNVKFH
ncbi:hypothetical protein K457DRAFT_882040 [Linnemannia elongata AG-77]|uniref:Phage tail protein n=1 Tax=Linnemannia elongata AG-77 TaxID=1314771 RepID=A0A197JFR6_9FUNG|nr:hypothetical protein K457DRAFT_882040 [Linnemannia elongata AG-77]